MRLDYEGDEAEASSRFEYDVFLSFRGSDTRKGFTGLLHAFLKLKGITAFIDSEDLKKGQKVEELFKCIQKSKIFVPIFSKGYAASKWCLKEITKMVECKRLIVPVFLDVEPRDVGNQTGPFKRAFKRHHKNKNIDKEEVSRWRAALTEAGKVSGYTLADTERDEAKLIRLIVKTIINEVNKTSLHVARHPVGLDYRIADVEEKLDVDDNNVRVVGIHGIGGIGKTTLAKAVYNQIYTSFDHSSFIANVRETAKQSNGLVSLQEKLLRDFFSDEYINISSIDKGIEMIKTRIRNEKVLLVLDDVDKKTQLDALAGSLDWFCSGSRIIITTRDKLTLGLKNVNLYEPKVLDDTQSLELFSWHAFGKKDPDPKFAELSRDVASAGAGLPLALTIFGSHFFDMKTEEEWKEELQKLQEDQDKEIHISLKISFDALNEKEKKVFLDIACFFLQENNIEFPWLMWKDCKFHPKTTINVLRHKSLININDDTGKFEMHDLIRDMGRKIVQDSRSRLWKDDDETLDILQTKKGRKKIEAVQLNSSTYDKRTYVEAESFVAMSELRMLRLGNFVHLKGKFKHLPKALRWLQWCIQGHMHSLPDGFHLENIVVLDLSNSRITQLWNPRGLESTKVFEKMKVLKLAWCLKLTSCPDFKRMPHLKKLDLNGCEEMSELHPSIGHLKSLTHLTLRHCASLKRVPQEIWQLTSLEELDLSHCTEITTLPSQMEGPKSSKQMLLGELKVLNFDCCSNINICPDLTNMPHLEKLNFSRCYKMSELHPSVGLLKSLVDLKLWHCTSLKELLPENWQLTSLKELDLSDCTKIITLPSQLGNSKSLARLSLKGCKRLVNVSGIQDLDKLEEISLHGCDNLIRCPLFLSNMTHLRRLDFGDCAKMTKLDPSIGHLKNLTDLILINCKSLKELPQEVSQLSSLINLDLTGCHQITALPKFISRLKQLEWLFLEQCSSLTEIPECICSFLNLKMLNASHCQRIAFLPNWIEKLKSLIHLDLSWTAIQELPHSIMSLENLRILSVSHCYQLKFLPQFPPSVTVLKARDCGKLVDIPDIKQMKLLSRLYLGGCRSLHDSFFERLQEAHFQNLEDFSISGWRLFDGGSSYPQSLSFLLPKQFEQGTVYLHVDNLDYFIWHIVSIEIMTGEAEFQFLASLKIEAYDTDGGAGCRELPTATFESDSELMKMAKQGEFNGKDDSLRRTMMIMRVSIDGDVLLLHGDLFTTIGKFPVDWTNPDPIKSDDNCVIVRFAWPSYVSPPLSPSSGSPSNLSPL